MSTVIFAVDYEIKAGNCLVAAIGLPRYTEQGIRGAEVESAAMRLRWQKR
jgi:hypothetical protein